MSSNTETARWGGSLAMVLALHAAAVAGALAWESHAPAAAPPPAAIMIELAPMPTAPQTTPTEKPPAEKQEIVEKPQPKKPDPLPKPPVVKKAEVALNRPKETPQETPPVKEMRKVEETSAPPSVAAPPAETAAAPAQGASIAPQSNVLPTWQGALLSHLEKHKRYPRSAQTRRQQGVCYVAFSIDRHGMVVARKLHKSSGYDSLDEETQNLLDRAQPLPPPPPEVAGDRIDLVVPVQFFLR